MLLPHVRCKRRPYKNSFTCTALHCTALCSYYQPLRQLYSDFGVILVMEFLMS